MSQPIRDQGGHLVFPIGTKNTNSGRKDVDVLLAVDSFVEFHSPVRRKSQKCLSQSEAMAAILFFPNCPKIMNLVEDIEILLPVKFR